MRASILAAPDDNRVRGDRVIFVRRALFALAFVTPETPATRAQSAEPSSIGEMKQRCMQFVADVSIAERGEPKC
jgi:hypothetical protein